MRPQCIDLHTHTSASDGSDSPTLLIQKAAAARLAAVAITDHDTLSGLEEAEQAGVQHGVEVIRGCEISTSSEYGEIHLLGLWIPKACAPVLDTLAMLRAARNKRNERILARLNALGLRLSPEEVQAESKGESVGRPHIARAMMRQGYVANVAAAFALYLGKDKPAFEPKSVLAPEQAISILHNLGATVSFAHPMLVRCPDAWRDALVGRLKECGLDALEAYHSEHSAKDERTAVGLAARYGLALTGGSDYHGAAKPRVQLGTGKGGLRVTVAVLERLKERRRAAGLPC